MYGFLLTAHGAWRWVVVVAGLAAVLVALAGWLRGAPWTPGAKRAGLLFTVSIDVQLLLGLLLLFTSPLVAAALQDFGGAMRERELRFVTVEHTSAMVLAFLLAHAAPVLVRRAASDLARYRRAALVYGIALLLVIAGTPWMRPWLRA